MTTTATANAQGLRATIIDALEVKPTIDVEAEIERRVQFLASYLKSSGATGIVLGISGGIDSTTAGKLAQMACTAVGKEFTAMRLPYGVQADEADAQAAIAFIQPDNVVTVNIKDAVDALQAAGTLANDTSAHADFVKGNIKARIRMTAQYAEAGHRGALVLGTDHAGEATFGFFTKFGDGAADFLVLSGLTKGQVRQIASHLGADQHLVTKAPTADLEDLRPGLPDEAAHGVTYAEIDAYLTGGDISDQSATIIERAYLATQHKRSLPVTP
jgi:NAD+ synthase